MKPFPVFRAFAVPLLAAAFFLACAPNAHAQKNTKPSKIPDAHLPVVIQAYGNSYSIAECKVQRDEKDKTMILLVGNGFTRLPFRNGDIAIPVWCNMIVDGKEIEPVSAGVNGGSGACYFDTNAKPDAVVVYPGDAPEKKVKIPCK